MFIGEYNHTIDSKGRLIMPSKFRSELGEKFYITKGMDNCLFVFPQEEWDKIDKKINKLKLSRREARAFARLFYAGAIDVGLDKQGRTLISQNLRDYASLKKDIVIIGVSTRIEIWDKEIWDRYNDDDLLDYNSLTDSLTDLDL